MNLGLDLTGEIAVTTQGAGLAAVLTVNDVTTGHVGVSLDHQRLFNGILDALDLKLFATDGTT